MWYMILPETSTDVFEMGPVCGTWSYQKHPQMYLRWALYVVHDLTRNIHRCIWDGPCMWYMILPETSTDVLEMGPVCGTWSYQKHPQMYLRWALYVVHDLTRNIHRCIWDGPCMWYMILPDTSTDVLEMGPVCGTWSYQTRPQMYWRWALYVVHDLTRHVHRCIRDGPRMWYMILPDTSTDVLEMGRGDFPPLIMVVQSVKSCVPWLKLALLVLMMYLVWFNSDLVSLNRLSANALLFWKEH